jgi:uncharacterized protein
MQCKGLCQNGCGSVAMTRIEQQRIEENHGIRLPLLGVFGAEHCPALDDEGRCSVYADRPTVCRLYGLVPGMMCEHGCEPDPMLADVAGWHLLADVEDLAGNHDKAHELRSRIRMRVSAASAKPGPPSS